MVLETNTCLLVNQLLAGNHGHSDSSKFNYFFAMNRLASPQFIIPKIRQTNYHCPNQTTDLSDLLGSLLGASLIGKCRVPLGQSQEILYTMSPFRSFTQVEAKISFYTKLGLELAPETFFCIQKCSIDEASSLPWGICPPLEDSGYVAEPHRKASISSSISSDNTTDSGYASGREAERPTSPESQSIGRLEIGYEELTANCFFTLGKINWQLVTGGPVHTSDYVVALSLYDSSIWAIYDAWDDSDFTGVTEEEQNEAEDDPQPSFRPYQSKLWGRLPGLGNSKQAMLRIAENVQTWCFESNNRIDWRSCKGEWSSDDVPLFLPARKDSGGKPKPLFEPVQG